MVQSPGNTHPLLCLFGAPGAIALVTGPVWAGWQPVHWGFRAVEARFICTVRKGGQWQEQIRLLPPEGDRYGFGSFGSALDLDEGVLVAGAPGHDEEAKDAGLVMAYRLTDEEGTALLPGVPVAGERFGTDLALDGERLLVGAAGVDAAEAAYVFEYRNGTWRQVVRLSEKLGEHAGPRMIRGNPGARCLPMPLAMVAGAVRQHCARMRPRGATSSVRHWPLTTASRLSPHRAMTPGPTMPSISRLSFPARVKFDCA